MLQLARMAVFYSLNTNLSNEQKTREMEQFNDITVEIKDRQILRYFERNSSKSGRTSQIRGKLLIMFRSCFRKISIFQ